MRAEYTAARVEWIDDVKRWRAGDASAAEQLREYVTPFVHGALLARLPHHVASALMTEALDTALASPDDLERDAGFVRHAVGAARRLAKLSPAKSSQERPSDDPTVAEGRQWLERLRLLPEEVREVVLWRLVGGVPGPELVEVLGLDEGVVRVELEKGLGESLVPPVSLEGVDYVWDLSGEPSTQLARAETVAMALRFDPLAAPEPADVVNTGATFQDLSGAQVGVRPQANPFGDFAPTRVPQERRPPAGRFDTDEKTQGAFDLPAAARPAPRTEPMGPPKTEPMAPPREGSAKTEPVFPPRAERPSQRQPIVVAGPEPEERSVKRRTDDGRPSRKNPVVAMPSDERRRETREAPVPAKPSQTQDDADERPSRSRLQVRGRLEREEISARRRRPDEAVARSATEPESPVLSGVTPVGPQSESSLEPTDPEAPRRPIATTEPIAPIPVAPATRWIVVGVVVLVLVLAIVWRLRLT